MFVILTSQRAGSHLLASLLNSHPDLRCYDEIFLLPKTRPTKLGRKEFNKLKWNEGFILHYSQYMNLSDERKKIIKSRVIHLTRNKVNQAKSMKRNIKRAKRLIDYRWYVFRDKFENIYNITYEEICNNKNISEYSNDKLLKFLGVKPHTMKTNFKKGIDP